ncbi:hypothetical protein P43SY_006294 [Pythium insidiosum]|uniref:Uncharacterized protein n=1 Tax=Pythium insidiosum TaxID=114742 RepID=A0AAD5M6L7_PYTIN|nr:hypothetical protein P43SY_006294 [Pythium insidiosum]
MLAPLDFRAPSRLLVLSRDDARAGTSTGVAVVAQVRQNLLHYLCDGLVMCVIKAHSRIAAVVERPHADKSTKAPAIIVATVDGALWSVELPIARALSRPILLPAPSERHDEIHGGCGSAVQRLPANVPGAQLLSASPDGRALIATSLLTPTLVVSPTSSSVLLELDALDAERATALLTLAVGRLPQSWLRRAAGDQQQPSFVVFQGDEDGGVRFVGVDADTVSVVCSGELCRLQEPVQSLVLVGSAERDEALVALGVRGALALVDLTNGTATPAPPPRLGRFRDPVSSIAVVALDSMPNLLVCRRGRVDVLAIATLRSALFMDSTRFSPALDDHVTAATMLPQGIERIVSQSDGALVALSRDGRVHVVSRETLERLLPQALAGAEAEADNSSSSGVETQVKSLLEDIARVSSSADECRGLNARLDAQLRGLQSALQVLLAVQSDGVDACFSCPVGASLADCGWNAQRRSVRLRVGPVAVRSSRLATVAWDRWRVQVVVRADEAPQQATYTLAMGATQQESQAIVLEPGDRADTAAVLHVSLGLVFVPASDGSTPGVALAVPLSPDHEIHPLQLCEPVAAYPLGLAALREHAHTLNAATESEWWARWTQLASDAAITIGEQSGDDTASGHAAHLRCVVRLRLPRSASTPAIFPWTVDTIATFMRTIMWSGDDDHRDWAPACRLHQGKWWVGMKTLAGRLVVLRFGRSHHGDDDPELRDGEGSELVDVAVHAADATDLLAMRIFLRSARGVASGLEDKQRPNGGQVIQDLAHAVGDLGRTLQEMESAVSQALAPDSTHSQPEILRLLQRLADAESSLLAAYWKSRDAISDLRSTR